MDPEDTQQVTLNDAAEAAYESLENSAPEAKADAVPDHPEFEMPSWAQRWGEPARNSLKALGNAVHNRSHLDPILEQIGETNKYITRRDQEFAEYRRSLDPIAEIVRPLEAQYRLQGMSLQQGIAQMVEGAKFVAGDPDQAFPHFAGIYRPRDPATAVANIAKAWGVDLGQMAQEQPWVDPTVQALLTPLQRELAEIRQFRDQQQMAQQQQAYAMQQQQQDAVIAKLESLEKQTDESGNLRFPHLAAVFDDIVLLANTGRMKSIEEAYDRAVMMNPELSQEVAKAAEQRAIQEASARSAQVQKEAQANRPVAGSGRRQEVNQSMSLNDAAEQAYNQLYGP